MLVFVKKLLLVLDTAPGNYIIHFVKFITHCSWKPQMDGLKNAETSSMDFCTQLVTLKGWKKQFENLWADF